MKKEHLVMVRNIQRERNHHCSADMSALLLLMLHYKSVSERKRERSRRESEQKDGALNI